MNTTSKPTKSKAQPTWAARGPRAIPHIDKPSMSTLDTDVRANLRPLLVLLLARPIIGVAAFVAIALNGWWLFTPALLWFLYGSACSATHHLIHSGMGLSPRARHFWLTTIGLIIAESGHAWQATHVMHHRDGTDLPDPEGYIENLTWAELPAGAFMWRFRMMSWGYRFGQGQRRTGAELITILAMHLIAVVLTPLTLLPIVYLALMQAGSILFALMLAKGPQTNFGRNTQTPLIMVKTTLVGLFLFNHHLHLEHHLYPKVPMARLGTLTPVVEDAVGENVHEVRLAI